MCSFAPLLEAFPGAFELHLTTRCRSVAALRRFESVCEELDAKALVIQLSTGQYAHQPMLSMRLSEKQNRRISLAESVLKAAGFPILRTKLEASIFNQNIPQTEEDKARLSLWLDTEQLYFEHHLKIEISPENHTKWRSRLRAVGAHLSYNALKTEAGTTRFVTQRVKEGGLKEAHRHFNRLISQLKTWGFEPESPFQEFVVFDSRLELDSGWAE